MALIISCVIRTALALYMPWDYFLNELQEHYINIPEGSALWVNRTGTLKIQKRDPTVWQVNNCPEQRELAKQN